MEVDTWDILLWVNLWIVFNTVGITLYEAAKEAFDD